MTAKTRLGYEGFGVRRIVSFAGKTQTTIITATLAASEAPDVFSFAATFFPKTWHLVAAPSSTWTPAIKQTETWTPR